jgi:hypothetical protein
VGKKRNTLLGYGNLNSQPQLSNGSVNKFSQQRIHTVEELLEDKTHNTETMEMVFSMRSMARPYTRNKANS